MKAFIAIAKLFIVIVKSSSNLTLKVHTHPPKIHRRPATRYAAQTHPVTNMFANALRQIGSKRPVLAQLVRCVHLPAKGQTWPE